MSVYIKSLAVKLVRTSAYTLSNTVSLTICSGLENSGITVGRVERRSRTSRAYAMRMEFYFSFRGRGDFVLWNEQ